MLTEPSRIADCAAAMLLDHGATQARVTDLIDVIAERSTPFDHVLETCDDLCASIATRTASPVRTPERE